MIYVVIILMQVLGFALGVSFGYHSGRVDNYEDVVKFKEYEENKLRISQRSTEVVPIRAVTTFNVRNYKDGNKYTAFIEKEKLTRDILEHAAEYIVFSKNESSLTGEVDVTATLNVVKFPDAFFKYSEENKCQERAQR